MNRQIRLNLSHSDIAVAIFLTAINVGSIGSGSNIVFLVNIVTNIVVVGYALSYSSHEARPYWGVFALISLSHLYILLSDVLHSRVPIIVAAVGLISLMYLGALYMYQCGNIDKYRTHISLLMSISGLILGIYSLAILENTIIEILAGGLIGLCVVIIYFILREKIR